MYAKSKNGFSLKLVLSFTHIPVNIHCILFLWGESFVMTLFGFGVVLFMLTMYNQKHILNFFLLFAMFVPKMDIAFI